MQISIFILFNIPALALLISAFFICWKGKCDRGLRKYVSQMLIIVALSMALYAEYFNPYLVERHFWLFDFLFCLIASFCVPFYILFLNHMTDNRLMPVRNLVAFLPSILYAAMLITAQLLMTDADRDAYICNVVLGHSIHMDSSLAYDWMLMVGNRFFKFFIPLQAIFALIYGEHRLKKFLGNVVDFDDLGNTRYVSRLRGIHTLTIIGSALCLFISIIPIYELVEQIWLVGTFVLLEVILIVVLTTMIMRMEFLSDTVQLLNNEKIPDIRLEDYESESPAPVVVNVEPIPSLIARIDEAMEKERLFLSQDITLVTLSEKIGTNRTYVSKAIKDAKGCNFPDYLNRYRLDYAIELLKKTPKDEIMIQNIAVQCGCGSIQTFYRYFKLFFNETPTQWIERNK